MIKADIPQDVTDYKEQFFFGMNIRQFVSVAAMIALAVVTFLIGRNFIGESVLIYVIVLEVAPIAAIGFMQYNGMTFEKFIPKLGEFYFGEKRRKFVYISPETELHDKIRKIALEAEIREIKESRKCKKGKKK